MNSYTFIASGTGTNKRWLLKLPHGKDFPIGQIWVETDGPYVQLASQFFRCRISQRRISDVSEVQEYMAEIGRSKILHIDQKTLYHPYNTPFTLSVLFYARTVRTVSPLCILCFQKMGGAMDGECCHECEAPLHMKKEDVCKDCRKMGFGEKERKQGIAKIYIQKGSYQIHFPHCLKEKMYCCLSCKRWIDNPKRKTEEVMYERKKHRYGLCRSCVDMDRAYCCLCSKVGKAKDFLRKKGAHVCLKCYQRISENFSSSENTFVVHRKNGSENARTFGIELEINDVEEAYDLSKKIADIKIDSVGLHVKSDGSIYRGFEIVSDAAELPLLLPVVKALCRTVRQHGHTYDRAGLHIHFSDPSINPETPIQGILKLLKVWYVCEPAIFGILPPFRRNSEFCQPLRGESGINHLQDYLFQYFGSSKRYQAFNFNAYRRHKTMEIRCMDANTDIRRITSMLRIIDAIAEKAAIATPEDFERALGFSSSQVFTWLGLPHQTVKYLERLKERFNDRTLSPMTLDTPKRPKFQRDLLKLQEKKMPSEFIGSILTLQTPTPF